MSSTGSGNSDDSAGWTPAFWYVRVDIAFDAQNRAKNFTIWGPQNVWLNPKGFQSKDCSKAALENALEALFLPDINKSWSSSHCFQ